jgi:hypothetical protein
VTIELAITAGMTQMAKVTVDPAQVVGSGGGLSPALEITFKGSTNPRPNDSGIGVERITIQLWLPRQKPPVAIGAPATRFWPGGGGFHSSDRSSMETQFQLRFPMTVEQVRLLEAAATAAAPHELELELRGDVTVGWLPEVGGQMHGAGRDQLPPGIQNLGMFSQLQPFWTTEMHMNTLRLSREQLAKNILPGLGLDRVRLAAIRLPSGADALPQKLVGEYDAATRDFDAGRFREAIEKCRDVRYTIEQALGAKDTNGERVADQISKRGLAGERMVAFIDSIWKGLAELTNEAHHRSDTVAYTPTNARACLLTTAVMVEAISELLAPRPL